MFRRSRLTSVMALSALVAALLVPAQASALVYFTQPTPGPAGNAYVGVPTLLFAAEENGVGGPMFQGNITLGGTNIPISAIALAPDGTLYGFQNTLATSAVLVEINPANGVARVVGAGTPVMGDITGAGFDQMGNMWIVDLAADNIQRFDIATLSKTGTAFNLPTTSPVINGADIAFDRGNKCYVTTTSSAPTSRIYEVNTTTGAFDDLGGFTTTELDTTTPLVPGVGFGLNSQTCEDQLFLCDGHIIEELATIDLDSPTPFVTTEVVTTGINIAWYNLTDVAAFTSLSDAAACTTCGDGITVDGVEQCDDGNNNAGDGCAPNCRWERFSCEGGPTANTIWQGGPNDAPMSLRTIDPTTGAATTVVTFDGIGTGGIARDPVSGDIYFSDIRTAPFNLYRWNPMDGLVTIGPMGFTTGGMAFHPDGRLFILRGNPMEIYQVDKATGAPTSLQTFPGVSGGVGLLFDATGTGYIFANEIGAGNAYYTLSPDLMTLTQVAAPGVRVMNGLALTPSGDAYGTIGQQLYEFDLATGASVLVGMGVSESGDSTACGPTCVDDRDGGLDTGCDATDPVCDTSSAAAECVTCEDNEAPGMEDNGCSGGTPICDTSGAAPVCVGCLEDADCPGACDLTTNTCVVCLDNVAGGGTDAGCSAAEPICDNADPAMPFCTVCEDSTSGTGTDNGCSAGTPACVDDGGTRSCEPCADTAANGQDEGCPSTVPVCDDSMDPAVCVECLANADCPGGVCDTTTNTCATCMDTAMGADDQGCGDPRPVCLVSGGDGVCVPCEDNVMGTGMDFGCDMATPLCDITDATNPSCVVCFDNTSGGTDTGCDAANPVCDPNAAGGPTCLTCEDSAVAGLDNGCSAATPACNETAAGGPECVECLADADCTSGACDAATNLCVGCIDDSTDGTDSGCTDALPACDTDAPGGATCVVCEDTQTGMADLGCGGSTPACDDTGAVPVCVACENDSIGMTDFGCSDASPACDTDAPGGPACANCEDSATGSIDNGCTADTPACNEMATGGPTCQVCEANIDRTMDMTSADFDCADATPFCDTTDVDSPMCVQCTEDANCPMDAPVCNPSGTCTSGCNNDGQCADPTPVCDTASMTCVECTGDDDCGDAGTPVCDEGVFTCVECTADSECSEGVCDLGTNTCVGCSSDDDCEAPLPACDIAAETCVECVVNANCPVSAPVCTDDQTCVECQLDSDCPGGACLDSTNTCVECEVDDDCPGSAECDPATNTCGAECLSDADCIAVDPSEPVCDLGTCVECLMDDDCPDGFACDEPSKLCAPGCTADEDCAAPTPVCDTGDALCVECLVDEQCPDGACDTDTNTCIASCTTDDECTDASLPFCNTDAGVCAECTMDTQCGELLCDEDAGVCAECAVDADCTDGVCGDGGVCVECTDDGDCDGGRCDVLVNTCTGGCTNDDECMNPRIPVCLETAGLCVECEESSDCESGERCNIDANVCEPGCTLDTDCPAELPLCNVEVGQCVECNTDDQCADGERCNAETNTCAAACATDDDCESPTPACIEALGFCAECDADNQDECGEDLPVCDIDATRCVICTVEMADACATAATGTLCVEVGGGDNFCGCSTDDDCPMDATCDPADQTCKIGCSTDADCDGDLVCDDGECVEGGCTVDTDCAPGETCTEDGVCGSGACEDDEGCDDGQICTDDGVCIAGCREDSDCGDGESCIDNACASTCETDDDCGDDEMCIDDVCVPDGIVEPPIGGGTGGVAGGACSAVGGGDAGTFFAVLGLGALFWRRRR